MCHLWTKAFNCVQCSSMLFFSWRLLTYIPGTGYSFSPVLEKGNMGQSSQLTCDGHVALMSLAVFYVTNMVGNAALSSLSPHATAGFLPHTRAPGSEDHM